MNTATESHLGKLADVITVALFVITIADTKFDVSINLASSLVPIRLVTTIIIDTAFAATFSLLLLRYTFKNDGPFFIVYFMVIEIVNAWQSIYLIKNCLFDKDIDGFGVIVLFFIACATSAMLFVYFVFDRYIRHAGEDAAEITERMQFIAVITGFFYLCFFLSAVFPPGLEEAARITAVTPTAPDWSQ
ncbi:MAG: hypothetical protein AAFN27_22535 [Pseudomonadota bacterium]